MVDELDDTSMLFYGATCMLTCACSIDTLVSFLFFLLPISLHHGRFRTIELIPRYELRLDILRTHKAG